MFFCGQTYLWKFTENGRANFADGKFQGRQVSNFT